MNSLQNEIYQNLWNKSRIERSEVDSLLLEKVLFSWNDFVISLFKQDSEIFLTILWKTSLKILHFKLKTLRLYCLFCFLGTKTHSFISCSFFIPFILSYNCHSDVLLLQYPLFLNKNSVKVSSLNCAFEVFLSNWKICIVLYEKESEFYWLLLASFYYIFICEECAQLC